MLDYFIFSMIETVIIISVSYTIEWPELSMFMPLTMIRPLRSLFTVRKLCLVQPVWLIPYSDTS